MKARVYHVISHLRLSGRLRERMTHEHVVELKLTAYHEKSEDARAAPWLRGTAGYDL